MIKTQKKTNAIELKYLAEPLEDAHGTLGFRGTPVEKHCSKLLETKTLKVCKSFSFKAYFEENVLFLLSFW
jgi:hypothetical protein